MSIFEKWGNCLLAILISYEFPPIKMGGLIFPRDPFWANQLSVRTRNRSPDYGATEDVSE